MHIPQEDLQDKLEATATDSVGLIDTETMTIGLKRYSKDAAKKKGSRKHTEDELYHIIGGAGRITVGDEVYSVTSGDLVYIEQGESHDIIEIHDELTVLKILTDKSAFN
ncbi:cupin domain-containing protein [Salinarchaeum sp. IM2453]|uniref:cupin domain-containing protein n=1 Tax=Salinarchaeum sp. IM2453 TaxID=2862870 RepID=UPI001C838A70|nr:cupin domain-containing protein [Salinarchaeum sp. IM2453]QZA88225.1 cupin domain-containing protein [Salinarchaeum sp. IM2453]